VGDRAEQPGSHPRQGQYGLLGRRRATADAGTARGLGFDKSVRSPVGVDSTGKVAADFVAGAAQTFCSTVNDLTSGKQRLRTCEYAISGFTPDTKTVIGTPDFRNGGADPLVVALDSADGMIRREWTGVQFLEVVAEDDDHLLMVADSGEGTPGAIIRCTIATGACELATPLTKTSRIDVRLLGAWS
jgi:hypothetical protein